MFRQLLIVTDEAAGVEVMGVLESSTSGVLELLLSNRKVFHVSQDLWEPFDAALEKGKVFVNIKFIGQKIIEIEAVDRPCPSAQ